MVIGLTVVAYGTSTPEMAASIAAAIGLHTDLILGNVVGSNISNIGMVIGISAIISPLVVSKATTRKEVPIMIGVCCSWLQYLWMEKSHSTMEFC